MFDDNEDTQINLIENIKDWNFEERLSKEFESIGFFISDHPLNQFKDIFNDFKILDYQKFYSDDEIKENNIAATLLKIQERKTSKGNSYAVLKLTDLTSVFELFVFSDVLELNRDSLKEGSSLILTLNKTISSTDDKSKRINVRKIASIKDLDNKSIKEITFNLTSKKQLKDIQNFIEHEGKTVVFINLCNDKETHKFKLKNQKHRQKIN